MMDGGLSDQTPHASRTVWRERRMAMEQRLIREGRRSSMTGDRIQMTSSFGRTVAVITRLSGLYGHGHRTAGHPKLTRVTMVFADLPAAFDGYTILFASDLHVEVLPENIARATALLGGIGFDLAILGGDYQNFGRPIASEAGRVLAPLVARLHQAADGVVAVLGNHDHHDMLTILEAEGVRVLVNEWIELRRGGQCLHMVGIDDVHAFYTERAPAALRARHDGFRLAAVHSPELATAAAAAGISLYLAGHTHGGQIALPGGRIPWAAVDSHHHLAGGHWRHHRMQGYTSSGLGAGFPPVRFNTRPEIALITLRRAPAPT